MIKYVKQRDETSCAPIAVLNILKWKGISWATYKNLNIIKDLCGHDKKNGVGDGGLEYAMRGLSISFRRKSSLTLDEADRHIDSGGIFLIDYDINIMFSHCILCVARTNKFYTLVNEDGRYGKSVIKCSRKRFKKILSKRYPDAIIRSYFIRR